MTVVICLIKLNDVANRFNEMAFGTSWIYQSLQRCIVHGDDKPVQMTVM